jgi:putative sigma-54 modulation protein
MRLELTGHHVDITPPLRQLVERRIQKFDRMLNGAAVSALVICKMQKYHRVIDVTLHARNDRMLHAQGQGATWQAALSLAAARIERQAGTLKEKWKGRKRRAVGPRQLAAAEVAAAAEPPAPRVVRAAGYAVRPLSIDDAARRLQGRDEEFLVFRNHDTDELSILYRRKDGRFGLIEPEL